MVTPILPLSPARLIIFLLFIQLIPPMIVVGIGNVLGVRTHDLTPTHSIIDPYGKIDTSAGLSLQISGGGAKFLQFIKDELMPYIEKKYKPAPYKIFSGHSFGGLMTFYCLTKHPDMFNAYISVSPALWWDNKIHLKVATKNLRNTDYRNKLFFFQRCRWRGDFPSGCSVSWFLAWERKYSGIKIQVCILHWRITRFWNSKSLIWCFAIHLS